SNSRFSARLVLTGVNIATSSDGFLTHQQWYHVMACYDRSGSCQLFVDGVASGAAVDISSLSSSISNSATLRTFASGAGSARYDDRLAYFAMYKSAAWLDTHDQAALAAARYAIVSGSV